MISESCFVRQSMVLCRLLLKWENRLFAVCGKAYTLNIFNQWGRSRNAVAHRMRALWALMFILGRQMAESTDLQVHELLCVSFDFYSAQASDVPHVHMHAKKVG